MMIINVYQLPYLRIAFETKLSSDYVKSRLELQTCQHNLENTIKQFRIQEVTPSSGINSDSASATVIACEGDRVVEKRVI